MLPKTIPFLFANPDDVAEGEHGWCVNEYKTTALHNKSSGRITQCQRHTGLRFSCTYGIAFSFR